MKTSLYFEAPSDLSVGTIRIDGEGQAVAEWIATPENRTFRSEDVKPGIYSAEIGPAGVAPQSVVFEVREGEANEVILPTFLALSSSGSNTSFFDTERQQASVSLNRSNSIGDEHNSQPQRRGPSVATRENVPDLERARTVKFSKEKRRVSIALSEEAFGRDSFDTFRGLSRMNVFAGRVDLEILEDSGRDPWTDRRVRLTASVEGARIERCLLPLYRGGTRILVTASPFAPDDLEFSVLPADPNRRALLRALDAGTSAEVEAVRDEIVRKLHVPDMIGDRSDPWEAILIGLLAIRFPELFPPIDSHWADSLAKRAGWAFDAHVIQASQALTAAQRGGSEAQSIAVGRAVSLFSAAQVTGAPYYRFTNQLFGELAAGIMEYIKANESCVSPGAIRKFARVYSRWHRELSLQRGAGPTFTWLARDLVALKERGVLAPNRIPSGRLPWHNTSLLLEGEVGAGLITILRGRRDVGRSLPNDGSAVPPTSEQSDSLLASRLPNLPALARIPQAPLDPNKGRFGNRAKVDGFSLAAAFEPTKSRDWVAIALSLEADHSTRIGLGDIAWFVLHPSFSPSIVKVAFRGRRAQLRIQAWGGFTVGVWIPKANVELECDLAQIEGAPRIIRSR